MIFMRMRASVSYTHLDVYKRKECIKAHIFIKGDVRMPPKSAETRKELICQLMKEPSYVPMREKELACIMQVEREDREEFARLLQELLLEGKIQVNKRGRYSVPSKPPVIGTFIGHSKGFGFVASCV